MGRSAARCVPKVGGRPAGNDGFAIGEGLPGRRQGPNVPGATATRIGISTAPLSESELMIPASLLLAVAGVVLLIASLNVANMMLARVPRAGKGRHSAGIGR